MTIVMDITGTYLLSAMFILLVGGVVVKRQSHGMLLLKFGTVVFLVWVGYKLFV